MKIRSFTISLLVSVLFSMNMISCGSLPVVSTLTPSPTQTPTPTAIPTITATSTPAYPALDSLTLQESGLTLDDVKIVWQDQDGNWFAGEQNEDKKLSLNENEKWVLVISPEQQAAIDSVNIYLVQMGLDPSKFIVTFDADREVICTDKATAMEVCVEGKFSLAFAQESLANSGILESTSYIPKKGNVPLNSNWAPDKIGIDYLIPMMREWRRQYENVNGVDPYVKGDSTYVEIMLDPETLSWGSVWSQTGNKTFWQVLIYRNNSGEVIAVPLQQTLSTFVLTYWMNK